MPSERAKYTAKFKLEVIKFAETSNNVAAGREYRVSEKLVRDWRRDVEKISSMPRNKCANRGKVCQWPDLEESLSEWITDNRKCGYIITRNMIRIHAIAMAQQQNIPDFKGSRGWCDRFLNRNGLVLRQKTKVAQQLPHDLEEKITSFHSFVIRARRNENYELANIGNMDETPVWFDMPAARTISAKGEKTILVNTTGHEKSRFTTVLTCLADGTKLKPMVIFKWKTMPKDKFPPGAVIHVHPKGWMDDEGIKIWIDKVWKSRPGGLVRKKSLLVWDAFRVHLVDSAKRRLRKNATDVAVIPGGLTSVVQPLDVCLNKPFKDRLRQKWIDWMVEGEKSYTSGGRVKAPSLPTVTGWVVDSWRDIPGQMVEHSFKKCGISNAMDGTKDDVLWQEEDEENENDESEHDADEDVYDDRLTAEEWNNLFGESDDEEFEGF